MSKKSVQTIEDIARLANVSKSTVSRALNDSPLIAQETKDRIREIAREHHFQIHVSAQRLSRQESRTIAFVTHAYAHHFTLTDLFSLEMLDAISNTLAGKHYDLLMAHVNPYESDWANTYLNTGRADGFILMTSTRKQFHIKSLLDRAAPFIVWGIPQPDQCYCSVTGDNFTGGKLAAQHLLATGRRKIAFIGGPDSEIEVQRRYDGFASVMQAEGRPVDPALVAYTHYDPDEAAKEMVRLLEQTPDLDAVFITADSMAIAAMDVIRKTGRRVPDDVAVIGYDNLSIAAYCHPSLTTVSQNLPLVGRLLAENLIQYLEKDIITNVSVPVELVKRESA